jgi:hypothetical protein
VERLTRPAAWIAQGRLSIVTFTLDCRQARQVYSGPWLAVIITPTQGDPVRIDRVIGPFDCR